MEKKEYVCGTMRFTNEDYYLEDEILLEDNKANVYVAMGNWSEIFGIQVEDDDWINVYANYDLSSGSIDEELVLTWSKGEEELERYYRMNEDERMYMKDSVEVYMSRNGILLPKTQPFTVEFGPNGGQLTIGMEDSSGCRYDDVFTVCELKKRIGEYIDRYVAPLRTEGGEGR